MRNRAVGLRRAIYSRQPTSDIRRSTIEADRRYQETRVGPKPENP